MLVHRKPKEQHIKSALDSIHDPKNGMGLWSAGRIDGLEITKQGHVTIMIKIDPSEAKDFEDIRAMCELTLLDIKRVKRAQAILTAEKDNKNSSTPEQAQTSTPLQDTAKTAPKEQPVSTPKAAQPQEAITLQAHAASLNYLPHVKHVIAVASGKGGVGKSTVAANLAAALTRKKLSVGILDADIYGPSQPLMYGADNTDIEIKDKKFIPIERHGVKLMSAGFLVPGKAPLVWRGPMVHKAIIQMIKDTAWADEENPLDVLVIDMPPGTGDVGLTLAKHIVISGAVVVTTPQDIALEDARKGLDMFDKLDIKTLGLIENMSQFCCPNCGHASDIFGSGGAKAEADKRNIPLLGKLSLFMDTRVCADNGTPIVLAEPHHDATSEYLDIADKIISAL